MPVPVRKLNPGDSEIPLGVVVSLYSGERVTADCMEVLLSDVGVLEKANGEWRPSAGGGRQSTLGRTPVGMIDILFRS